MILISETSQAAVEVVRDITSTMVEKNELVVRNLAIALIAV